MLGELEFDIAWCCQPHWMGHGQHLNLKWVWMDGWMDGMACCLSSCLVNYSYVNSLVLENTWSKQLFNLPRCFEIRNFWFKFQPTLHWCTTDLPARIPFHTMIYPYRMIKTHRLKQIDMHMCQMFNYYIEICIVYTMYIYIYTIMSYPYNYCGSPSTLSLSPSDKSSSYHQLSWSLEAMRYGLTMVGSHSKI